MLAVGPVGLLVLVGEAWPDAAALAEEKAEKVDLAAIHRARRLGLTAIIDQFLLRNLAVIIDIDHEDEFDRPAILDSVLFPIANPAAGILHPVKFLRKVRAAHDVDRHDRG